MPLDLDAIRLVVEKDENRILIKQVRPLIKLDFGEKKRLFLEEFDKDNVTQELEDGPEAYSRIPALAAAGGNLFSLLGFYDEQKPAESLREYLKDNIVLYKTSAGRKVGDQIVFDTPILAPSETEINAVMSADSDSSLEWTNRSYTDLLARGVSGLPKYLFDLTRDFSKVPSRSGPAIQAKGNLRGGSVGPIPYVRGLLGVLKRLMSPRG